MDFAGVENLNAPDANGFTALHKACLIGDWETVGELIKGGADVKVQDPRGRNAAWFAQLHLKAWTASAKDVFHKAGCDLFAACQPLIPDDAGAIELAKKIFKATTK